MPGADSALLRQLSSNNARYRDPLAVIDWGALDLDSHWLPEPALSLYGLPDFDTLSSAVRRRLSQYEFIILTAHIVDEARHIALARGQFEMHLRECGAARRTLLAAAARLLLDQLVSVFYFPPARFYELAGLTRGSFWRRLALGNPRRRQFIAQCLAPTLRMLEGYGLKTKV